MSSVECVALERSVQNTLSSRPVRPNHSWFFYFSDLVTLECQAVLLLEQFMLLGLCSGIMNRYVELIYCMPTDVSDEERRALLQL